MDGASISAEQYNALKAAEMTEKQLQAAVIAAAHSLGWMVYHTYSSVRSAPGYPDLHMVHTRQRRSLFVELKTQKGKLSPAQQQWILALEDAGCTARVWRPIDWFSGRIQDVLAGGAA
jgi:hypothetical protein